MEERNSNELRYEEMTAKTMHGLEELLAEEITNIGGKVNEVGHRAVQFSGSKEVMYRANLELRLALRVLVPIYSFKAKNEKLLYHKLYNFDWRDYLSVNQTFAIDCVCNSKYFTHSLYAAQKSKDAIVDRFRRHFRRRPDVDVNRPDIQLHIYIWEDEIKIFLDSSGDSLHKRGYRRGRGAAPLNEVLAAGMIMLSGWTGDRPLLDPMCGTGTLLIEAAHIARNVPPGLKRDYFCFMNWVDYDEDLWKKVYREARSNIKRTEVRLFGSDFSPSALDRCKRNLEFSNTEDFIELECESFEDLVRPLEDEPMTIILNPPYGERLQPENIEELYTKIGDTLKHRYQGCDAWIISSSQEGLKKIALHANKKYTLYNGGLECKYQKFELYAGSRKASKNPPIDK